MTCSSLERSEASSFSVSVKEACESSSVAMETRRVREVPPVRLLDIVGARREIFDVLNQHADGCPPMIAGASERSAQVRNEMTVLIDKGQRLLSKRRSEWLMRLVKLLRPTLHGFACGLLEPVRNMGGSGSGGNGCPLEVTVLRFLVSAQLPQFQHSSLYSSSSCLPSSWTSGEMVNACITDG